MTKRYHQPGHEGVTSAVDKLQQEVSVPGGMCSGLPQHGAVSLQATGVIHLLAVVPLLWQQQLPGLEGQ
jgi:hypothetical protein